MKKKGPITEAEETRIKNAEAVQKLQKHFEGHGKPKTRRDFMARGLLAGSSYLLMPSLVNLLKSPSLLAEELTCNLSGAGSNPNFPLIVFDFQGGAHFAAEILLGQIGGQTNPLSNLINYGIPTDLGNVSSGEFGLRFRNDSAALQGLRASVPASMRSNIDGFSVACHTPDDTQETYMNPMGFLSKFGSFGSLSFSFGTRAADSGGYAKANPGSFSPDKRPTRITNATMARLLVSRGATYNALVSSETAAVAMGQQSKVRQALAQLSESQLSRFSNLTPNEQIHHLIQCGHLKAESLLERVSPTQVFPANGTAEYNELANIFGSEPENNRVAVISYMLTQGFGSAATIEFEGHDDHDSTAHTSRRSVYNRFRQIGSTMRYFLMKNKPAFFMIITDGAMGKTNVTDSVDDNGNPGAEGGIPSANFLPGGAGMNTRPGDAASLTAHMAFVVHPTVSRISNPAAFVNNSGRQIGAFSSTGVNLAHLPLIARDPSMMSLAMIYNYLSLQGKEDQITLTRRGGDNPFANIDSQVRIFKKIT